MLRLFKITGDSLYPFYKNGQRVLCRKVYSCTNLKIKDTVIFEKENYGLMIKQVKTMTKNTYFVEGTDPMSIDSRNFGLLQKEEIKYKVLFRI